jgi:Pumilio-family RNA binding repeat
MDRDLSDNFHHTRRSPVRPRLGKLRVFTEPRPDPRATASGVQGSPWARLPDWLSCWKKLSDRIEANHSSENLTLRARPAELPLKDAVHMRFHDLKLLRSLPRKQSERSDSSLAQPKVKSLPLTGPPAASELGPTAQAIPAAVLCEASDESLLDWSTRSKISSMALQASIDGCSEVCLDRLFGFAKNCLDSLVAHRFGSYLIQKLLVRDRRMASLLTDYCQAYFNKLATDEYSSRIMQRLIELSPAFRRFAMLTFKSDLELYTKGVAAGFLVSAGVLHSQSEVERDVISNHIKKGSPHKILENKYFKKILVTYLSVCSAEKLDKLFVWLRFDKGLRYFLQDKHSCFILIKYLERHHQGSSAALLDTLKRKTLSIIRTKFFGYFIGQLVKKKETALLCLEISKTLRSVYSEDFRKLLREPILYQVYCGSISILNLIEH